MVRSMVEVNDKVVRLELEGKIVVESNCSARPLSTCSYDSYSKEGIESVFSRVLREYWEGVLMS